jgi:hypothetical protein
VTNDSIIPTPKMLNVMKPISIEKKTKGFFSVLNWMPNSIASINPIIKSWLPYNALSSGRSGGAKRQCRDPAPKRRCWLNLLGTFALTYLTRRTLPLPPNIRCCALVVVIPQSSISQRRDPASVRYKTVLIDSVVAQVSESVIDSFFE